MVLGFMVWRISRYVYVYQIPTLLDISRYIQLHNSRYLKCDYQIRTYICYHTVLGTLEPCLVATPEYI